MKQMVSVLVVTVLLLLSVAAVPLSAATGNTGVTPTTTLPSTTTSTDWDCHSTNTTLPTTTGTTLNLTGPDGINPDYTTTTGNVSSFNEIDLLTTAYVGTGDTVSLLAGPEEGLGFCADCYSLDGGVIAVTPSNGYTVDLSVYRYLHMTVNTNMPFTVSLMDHNNVVNSGTSLWFGAAMNSEESMIAKGAYVAVIDLHERYEAYLGYVPDTVSISKMEILLYSAGSISVGHLALSASGVCGEVPPAIQTTTFPSFPGSGDTTTTTNPTVGDVLLPGDIDDDGNITTADVRLMLSYLVDVGDLAERQWMLADVTGDGVLDTLDARYMLRTLV